MGMDTTPARREERGGDHRKRTHDHYARRRDYQRNTNGRRARRRNDQERPTVAAHAGATTKGTTNSRRARRRDDQGNDQRPPRTPVRRPGETNGCRAHRRDDQERPTVTAHAGATTRGAVRIHDPCLTFSSRKGCPTAMHAGMTARTTAGADLPPLPTTGAPHCI